MKFPIKRKHTPTPSPVDSGDGVSFDPAAPKPRFRLPFRRGEELDLSPLESGSTTIRDILSPTAADLIPRGYVIIDGVYHTYLYLAGYGYSCSVGNGWLSHLVEAGEGVSISFTIHRQSKEKILPKVAQTTMLNRSRMRDVGDTRQDYEELDSAITSVLYLKEQMNRQGEDFYYMHTAIEVVADDPETLEQRLSAVETLCVATDMLPKRCDFKHEQAFLSSLPLLHLDPDIERNRPPGSGWRGGPLGLQRPAKVPGGLRLQAQCLSPEGARPSTA